MRRPRRKSGRRERSEIDQAAALPEGVRPASESGLLAQRAIERGISVDVTYKRGGRRYLVLTDGATTHTFRNGRSTLTHPLARRCAQQKEVTAALLRHGGVPGPVNAVFGASEVARAWAWAEGALPIVVKPHAANKGTLVHVGVRDEGTFRAAFDRVADRFGEVLVEESIPGVEHRFATVGTRVVAVTRRVPMHVVGDGRSSVADLIEGKNQERKRRGNPIHKRLAVDDMVASVLAEDGWSLDAVPDDGSTVWLRRTSNISLGGDAVDYTDEVDPSHVALAESAVKLFPGLASGGLDVMIDGADARILEVNPHPMFTMHHFPWEGRSRDVYRHLLDAMFPDSRQGAPSKRSGQ